MDPLAVVAQARFPPCSSVCGCTARSLLRSIHQSCGQWFLATKPVVMASMATQTIHTTQAGSDKLTYQSSSCSRTATASAISSVEAIHDGMLSWTVMTALLLLLFQRPPAYTIRNTQIKLMRGTTRSRTVGSPASASGGAQTPKRRGPGTSCGTMSRFGCSSRTSWSFSVSAIATVCKGSKCSHAPTNVCARLSMP